MKEIDGSIFAITDKCDTFGTTQCNLALRNKFKRHHVIKHYIDLALICEDISNKWV